MKNWKGLLSGVAPTIATALGGPLAGTAVKYLAAEFMDNPYANESDVKMALSQATPEQLATLKQLDHSFEIKMRELEIDIYEISAQDRQDARKMARETSLMPQLALTLIFVGGFFALLFVIYSGLITLDNTLRDSANILLGIVAAGVPMILKFWFGGSPHDDKNLERIHKSTPN